MDQFDRHGKIEDEDFESADNTDEMGEDLERVASASPPREKDAVSGQASSGAYKGESKRPRARTQLELSLQSREDEDEYDDDEQWDDDDDDDSSDELPAVSRKVRRRRRRTRPRSKTIAMKRLTREELRIGALMYPPVDVPRPRARMECQSEIRPCPWVACKHHLYLDVNPETGSIKINFPDLEPWELQQTCALDVAERGGITLEEVGEIMNLTRERIRQVEVRGLRKIRATSPSPEELGALSPQDID